MVNKKVIRKWLKALRSGEYKQGRHALNTNDQYCCLGVLCELAVKEKVVTKYKDEWTTHAVYDGEMYALPACVRDWAELDSCNPCVIFKNRSEVSLAELNDQGRSFKQIARIIENKFLKAKPKAKNKSK